MLPSLQDSEPASAAQDASVWQDLAFAAGGLLAAVAAAVVVHKLLFTALRRWLADSATTAEGFLRRARLPVLLVFCVLAVQLVLPSLALTPAALGPLMHGIGIAVIVAIAWLLVIVAHAAEWFVTRRHDVTAADNLRARSIHTQMRILRRTLTAVIAIVATAAVLMTFPRVQQVGASLLASAGIAGLVVGLAARPAAENVIAGLQLAFTEPIRIDDVVVVAGEWGRVEEITGTYVVIRVWDERRLIVPFTKFISEPFQNWTRTSSQILGTVMLHVDYRVPVDAARAELQRIAEGSELWDRRVCGLQVTEITERTVQLRALVSAGDAGRAWDLRCLVRERMLAWLQREHPDSLPRVRAELEGTDRSGAVTSDSVPSA